MAKLRWRGDQAAYVTPLDRIVEPDEVVEVPDRLMKQPEHVEQVVDGKKTKVQIGWLGYEWPEELWAVVAEPKPTKNKDEE